MTIAALSLLLAIVTSLAAITSVPATTAELVPLLIYLVGPGSGVIASLVFDWARKARPAPADSAPLDLVQTLLHVPFYARWSSFALATIVTLIFTVPLAWLQGGDIVTALDIQFASALAIVTSQVVHGRTLAKT
jgi:hypothetical protein